MKLTKWKKISLYVYLIHQEVYILKYGLYSGNKNTYLESPLMTRNFIWLNSLSIIRSHVKDMFNQYDKLLSTLKRNKIVLLTFWKIRLKQHHTNKINIRKDSVHLTIQILFSLNLFFSSISISPTKSILFSTWWSQELLLLEYGRGFILIFCNSTKIDKSHWMTPSACYKYFQS